MAFSAIIWGAGDNVGPVPVGATVNVTTVDGLQCSANSLPIGCLHATGPFMRFPDLRAQTRDSCSRQGKNRGCARLITPPPPPPFRTDSLGSSRSSDSCRPAAAGGRWSLPTSATDTAAGGCVRLPAVDASGVHARAQPPAEIRRARIAQTSAQRPESADLTGGLRPDGARLGAPVVGLHHLHPPDRVFLTILTVCAALRASGFDHPQQAIAG